MNTLVENFMNQEPEYIALFGGPSIEEAQETAKKLMAKRNSAINCAMPHVPPGSAGHISHLLGLVSENYGLGKDSVRMLYGKIPFVAWVGLYKAFISEGFTDGDLYRFVGLDSFSDDYEKEMRIYFMWKY